MQLAQGAHPRAVVCIVRGIRTVQQQCITVGERPCCQRAEQAALAVVAAVGGIGGDRRIGQHVQLQHGQLRAERGAQAPCVLQLKLRLKGRLDEIGADAAPGLTRGIEQIRGVNAPGKAERGLRMLCKIRG